MNCMDLCCFIVSECMSTFIYTTDINWIKSYNKDNNITAYRLVAKNISISKNAVHLKFLDVH